MNDAFRWHQRHLPELLQLEELIALGERWMRASVVHQVDHPHGPLPVHVLELGSRNPRAPVMGFFGGVHGVERIGSQILLYWLHTLIHRLSWDDALHRRLEQMRIVIMPMVNPGGLANRTRCNPNGVDLMRNAPVDADGRVAFLVGGHRISRHLPWYRGRAGAPMEAEAQAVLRAVRERIAGAPFAMTLDCHSGFGRQDRLWCCYARRHQPMPNLADVYALKTLREDSFPHHHPYLVEPQSLNYTTHGDLWDYLYDESLQQHPDCTFLPLTLEMGSWLWVRKNPRQMLDFFGYFNPVISHRHSRVLRQHLPLLEFLLAATNHWHTWLPTPRQRVQLVEQAHRLWFDS
jgi:hypothetical protein